MALYLSTAYVCGYCARVFCRCGKPLLLKLVSRVLPLRRPLTEALAEGRLLR